MKCADCNFYIPCKPIRGTNKQDVSAGLGKCGLKQENATTRYFVRFDAECCENYKSKKGESK